jgi:UDP-glucose 4-epimerase
VKIFISGVKGFVGKFLRQECREQHIEIVCTDVFESFEEGYYAADINSKDIVDIIPEASDALIHLASLSRDKDCKDNEFECFKVNVMGTLNLMEAARKKKVRNFIFASTEWVYDKFDNGEVKDEESFINIENLKSEYALSKLVSEINLRQKYQHGFMNTTILRFGIIYGPRPSNWSAVEALFNDVRTKEEIVVDSLETGRCFIHVSDIVKGVVKSINLQGLNLINLQGDRLITLREIIQMAGKILNKSPGIIEKKPNAISIRNISNLKAKQLLDWSPQYDLEKGLQTLL